MRRISPAFMLLLVLTPLAACRRHDDPKVNVRGASAPAVTLGPGDVRIFNADSSVDLVLVGDTISAGLSDRTVAQVQQEASDPADADRGVAGAIAKIVKKTVASTIGTRIQFPLETVRDVRYEDGGFTIDGTDGRHRSLFSNDKRSTVQTDQPFRTADAERFIAAVRARKRALGQD